jgi:glycosyltransferase involved in cell wall biosynthesis
MRILFVQPSMSPPGGGNGVAAWMLQALTPEHEVTVLTWWPMDIGLMNRFWGTSLRAGDFTAVQIPARVRRVVDRMPLPLSMLRTAILLRETRRRHGTYDVPVTANNETDFGTLGVQYVHYPWNFFPRPKVDYHWYHFRPLLPPYYALCNRLSGFTAEGMHRNVTLVNSNWTGRLAHQRYGFVSRTVYPPVTGDFPDVPWESRAPGFVCIGRIAPEKELDRVIDIVSGVRRHVPEVTLHIVGTPDHKQYARRIAQRAREAGFTIHHDLSRPALADLVSRQRYGIHGMLEEHFGMAPAELVRAGCLTWVHDAGGQVEIVDDPRLVYGSVEDAVGKIVATLRDPHETATLRKHLATRGAMFSTERFMREVREAVADAARLNARAV